MNCWQCRHHQYVSPLDIGKQDSLDNNKAATARLINKLAKKKGLLLMLKLFQCQYLNELCWVKRNLAGVPVLSSQ